MMKFLGVAAVLAVAVAICSGTPVPKKHINEQVTLNIAGDTPAELQESVRKARQIIEEINIDIINGGGGGFGGGGGYGGAPYGYGGYNGGGGFQNGGGYGGYGGYGGGYEDININIENF